MSNQHSHKPEQGSFLTDRIRSFAYALTGIATLLREQQNAWVHLLATLLVIGLGLWFSISVTDWSLVIIAIALVWMAEALNTAIELVCDLVSSEYHPLVKKAKDISAGAVLVTAVGAAIIGLMIFLPYLVE